MQTYDLVTHLGLCFPKWSCEQVINIKIYGYTEKLGYVTGPILPAPFFSSCGIHGIFFIPMKKTSIYYDGIYKKEGVISATLLL